MPDHATEARATYGLSGVLVAAGSVVLFIGTLFYVRLTPALGLPAIAGDRVQALADALAVDPQRMSLAGGFAFVGDFLLAAGCIALVTRRKLTGSDLERFGWTLIAVSAANAMVFDSMMAVLLAPLAHLRDPGIFVAFKTWFDFLFAGGDVPFGLGAIAVLSADMRSDVPLLPKAFAGFGIVVGVAALVSGSAYVSGLLVVPPALGLTVTLGCVVFAALGAQIARHEDGRTLRARVPPGLASAPAGVR
jgi:hypothetical protein